MGFYIIPSINPEQEDGDKLEYNGLDTKAWMPRIGRIQTIKGDNDEQQNN